MSLLPEQIGQLSRLIHLKLTPEQTDSATTALNALLELVAPLQAALDPAIEPLAHPGVDSLRLREDLVTETDQHALFQSIAAQTEAGLYLVPKVIE